MEAEFSLETRQNLQDYMALRTDHDSLVPNSTSHKLKPILNIYDSKLRRRTLNEGARARERNGRTSTDLIRSFKILGTEHMNEAATSRSILDNMLDW
jgi:uncharacterized protein (UPF0218 family)